MVDAVSKGDIDEMVALITSGIDVNVTLEVCSLYLPIETHTLNLHSVCLSNLYNDIFFFLQSGATLLMVAAYKGLIEVLSVLLIYGADLNLQNNV